MQNQPISAERAADLLGRLLPELARVEMYPQWSDGTGVEVRRQRVTLYDAAGDILGADLEEHRAVLRVLMRVEGGDWDRPQTFTVDGATLALTYPVVPVVPLWMSPVAEPDTARDCARSLAEGHMTPPVWDDPAPTRRVQEDVALLLGLPEPTQPARPVEDAPVQGGAL